MNKKGFTLVELLAVLIILGIVVGITIVSINTNIDNIKDKSEEAFINTIEDALDIYLDSDAKKLTFNTNIAGYICKQHGKRAPEPVSVYKANNNVSFSSVISSYNSLTEKDFINPKNKEVCDTNGEIIEIYRDDDYVYYYKIVKRKLECLELDLDGYITNLPDELSEGGTCS